MIEVPMMMKVGRKTYQVASLAEASQMFCAARDRSGLGASRIQPALIFMGDKQIGYVSYNGRVWEGSPQDWQTDTKLLFDNRMEEIAS